MKAKTRLKLTLIAGFLLSLMALLAIYNHMETVATTSIAGIMTILSAYIWAQTKRPSSYDTLKKINRCPSNSDVSSAGIQQDDESE